MIDLLAQIHFGKLSLDEAYDLLEGFKDRDDVEDTETWVNFFGFSRYESTARVHGASLLDLVKLRYEGWPTKCYRCKRI